MSRAVELELRRAVRTRDAFLSAVADQVEARVARLAAGSGAGRAHAVEALRGLARELSIIAWPRRPIPVRARRLELTAFLAGMFDPATCARRGIRAETTRGGAVVGRWDAGLLESILGELVSNAVKYGKGKPITIRVSLRGARARVVVSNAGTWRGPAGPIGRFRREESRGRVRGYGVGLWLARRLARALGGGLTFTSEGGESRAVVALPFTTARGDVSRFGVRLARAAPPRAATLGA